MWTNRLAWFEVLGARLRLAVRRDIARRTADSEESEAISDLTQDALCTATERIEEFRGATEHELVAWVCTIGERKLSDFRRSQRRQKRDVRRTSNLELGDEISSDDGPPDAKLLEEERRRWVIDLVGDLPEPEQSAIRLYYFLNKPISEVARRLGRTELAARGLVKRGLTRLRRFASGERPGSCSESAETH